jgi:hypothetical protein
MKETYHKYKSWYGFTHIKQMVFVFLVRWRRTEDRHDGPPI